MKETRPASYHAWGISTSSRKGTAWISGHAGWPRIYTTREKAREDAKRIRCLGLCATPIRVRVQVEAI